MPLAHGHLGEGPPVRLHGDAVGGERALAQQHLVLGHGEGPDEQLDELVRAAAQDHLLRLHAQVLGQPAHQREAGRVRVEVHLSRPPMASMALGEGPSGFSLEASLMTPLRPYSRSVSSMGLPGTGGLRVSM